MKGGIWLKRGLMMQNYCPRKDILIKIVVSVDSLMMVKSDQREDIEHNSIKMTRKNTAQLLVRFKTLKYSNKVLRCTKVRALPIKITLCLFSVFQPGFRGTQRFRQFLAGFPENAINSTVWSV